MKAHPQRSLSALPQHITSTFRTQSILRTRSFNFGVRQQLHEFYCYISQKTSSPVPHPPNPTWEVNSSRIPSTHNIPAMECYKQRAQPYIVTHPFTITNIYRYRKYVTYSLHLCSTVATFQRTVNSSESKSADYFLPFNIIKKWYLIATNPLLNTLSMRNTQEVIQNQMRCSNWDITPSSHSLHSPVRAERLILFTAFSLSYYHQRTVQSDDSNQQK